MITLIFTPITYYFSFVSYFNPFQKIRNKAANVQITILVIVAKYTSSSTVLSFFGNSNTTSRNVRAICCKEYYYGWIHITNFFIILIIGFSSFNFVQSKKIWNILVESLFSRIRCESWTLGKFYGQAHCWEQDWFTVGVLPILKWLSFLWYCTHSVYEW